MSPDASPRDKRDTLRGTTESIVTSSEHTCHQVLHARFNTRVGEHFSHEGIFAFVLDLVAAEYNVDVDLAGAFAPHFVILLTAPANRQVAYKHGAFQA